MAEARSADPRETVALVVPIYNELEALGRLIREVEAFRRSRPWIVQVVAVDDGSTDGSTDRFRSLTHDLPGYLLVEFSRNFGQQLAITAGLAAVTADAAVVLDADLQDPLEVIDGFVQRWREGYDNVFGVRRSRAGERLPLLTARHAFYVFFRRFTGVEAPVDVGDFRLVSRSVIDAFRTFGEQQPYVRGLIPWLGFAQIGVEYDRVERESGASKYSLAKLTRLASSGLTSFSNRPLVYAVRLGVLVSALSVVGIVWAVVTKILYPETISGWSSLIFVGFFFGGIQILILGILGTYVGRIYDEVKARPRYVIRRMWQSGDGTRASEEGGPR